MAAQPENRQDNPKTGPSGHLLILACSMRKRQTRSSTPAIHLYDGVNYRILRKALFERGWPPGLQIKILSAKYGLIDATTLVGPYDMRLDAHAANKLNKQTLLRLNRVPKPHSIFVNLGTDYLPAVNGLEEIFPDSTITFAPGPIGMKMSAMKRWLAGLTCGTATVRGYLKKQQSYLYFFPDWDDYIYEPFIPEDENLTVRKKTYAHEACSPRVPFDGILLSLSHLYSGKGALHHFASPGTARVNLRRKLRLPPHILLFGDCGAFSYANKSEPPFTPHQAAELYHKFHFDIGASVDHIPLPLITTRRTNGHKEKRILSKWTRYKRMYLTRNNAATFLSVSREKKYNFTPLGVIQGINAASYVARLHEYIDMGYEHIALGGLVPRSDDEILEILCAVRYALQLRTRQLTHNLWLHLFGILRPRLQPIFKELGVSSFDSASYFRKAWLRSDQNYLAPDGRRWYGTIRIPISSSNRMRQAATNNGLSQSELAEMERLCLEAIAACDSNPSADKQVIASIDRYGPLLERTSEDNHFSQKHALLLKDRPWENCRCPFCRSANMHVVVFRGAGRNKRRGLHNTWVFYHRILHGNALPTSSWENK